MPRIHVEQSTVARCAVCNSPVNTLNPDIGPLCRCMMEEALFRDGVEVEMTATFFYPSKAVKHRGSVVGSLVFIDGDPHADVRWSTGNVTRVSTAFLKTVQR